MRIWLLMTLLAGVARCWHQSDWFGMLTSRQRNAACATRCDYHLRRASSWGTASGDISTASLLQYSWQLPLDVHLWGVLNPLRDAGAIPPVLLPARTAVRGDGAEAGVESPSLQTCHLFERCHVHVPLCMMRVRQAVFSVFFSLIWESELLQAGNLLCGVLHVQALNMKPMQGHIFPSPSFFF